MLGYSKAGKQEFVEQDVKGCCVSSYVCPSSGADLINKYQSGMELSLSISLLLLLHGIWSNFISILNASSQLDYPCVTLNNSL